MKISRRVFFSSLLLARFSQAPAFRVVVLEAFDTGPGNSALLVHHADDATREVFAKWLQAHPRAAVRLGANGAEETAATIFRVRMCFGRGLIVPEKPVQIRERDIVIVRP